MFDHTFGNSQGGYAVLSKIHFEIFLIYKKQISPFLIIIDTESPIPQGWSGKLESIIIEGSSTLSCVRFWYHM